ncbi:Serine/threonine-protein kinase [Lachnellula occidentalis]|uniref:Serine/threonine-protein kinase n=1 Tax=Lachnellula occidentalis TaxID=215460 RepID=A0A8H8UBL4_9HELO|nr:Serine/threonine-protein kinase [Lachnellula occidentalis]
MDSTQRNPDSIQAPSIAATVPQSQSPEILETSSTPKDEDTSVEAITPSANDDNVQTQIKPRSGVLTITLHEGLGISIPERYMLSSEHDKPQDTGSESKSVTPTTGVSLDVSDAHRAPGNGHSGEVGGFRAGTPKRGSGVYAVLECEKSQVLRYTRYTFSVTVENPLWGHLACRFDVSRSTDFSIYIYAKNPLSTPESGRTQDILLGVARSNHGFKSSQSGAQDLDEAQSTIVKTNQGNKYTFSYTEWLEVEHGTGKIHVSVDYSEHDPQPLRIEDFDIMKQMVTGKSGNTIFQVYKRATGRLYALKEIRNPTTASQAQDADAVEMTKLRALSLANNPFMVPIKFVFQSAGTLYRYLVSPFVRGGELIQLLCNERCSDMDRIKHYAAEILCALECLHDFGIVYGYLKSQNILLDYSGHISICDFSLGQPHTEDHTDEACAPEICLGQGYTQTADWWTLGILLIEMLTIPSPNSNTSWYVDNITNIHSNTRPLVFPAVVPPLAQDICIKLLNRDPEQRLGARGVADIKAHSFLRRHRLEYGSEARIRTGVQTKRCLLS